MILAAYPRSELNPSEAQACLNDWTGGNRRLALTSDDAEPVGSYRASRCCCGFTQGGNDLYREGVERNTGQVSGDMGQWDAADGTANDAAHAA